MKKPKNRKGSHFKAKNVGIKGALRREKERLSRAAFNRFICFLRLRSKMERIPFNPPKYIMGKFSSHLGEKPKYKDTLAFLLPKIDRFSPEKIPKREDGRLQLPAIFSLSENYAESMYFLKRLFYVLHHCRLTHVYIDYEKCISLDLDASICMDLILINFINHYKHCVKKGHIIKIDEIIPLNFKNENKEIGKVLYSIGAQKNINGLKINFPDVIAFDLRIGDNHDPNKAGVKEIHETEIVDYVLQCLKKMNRSLTPSAETNLSKVVGEVMANAEEHSKFRYRYAIGYFQDIEDAVERGGIFKLVIFNFGQTIYESFLNPDSPNLEVIEQMKNLSKKFTERGMIFKSSFEEETLWTLYSLQEGVTSKKDWKRGNGSIRFIESFFNLKDVSEKDNSSKLTLISGNTKIVFDGSYSLLSKQKNVTGKKYKLMTFNKSGEINELPDKKYVTFVPQYFPGTIISAKISLTYNNIETIKDANGD